MKNQCDGCQAGIPAINGVHRMGKPGGYPDGMSCQAYKYVREPDFHNQMMNIEYDPCMAHRSLEYKFGHKDARHKAAEIALKADKQISELLDTLEFVREQFDKVDKEGLGLPRGWNHDVFRLIDDQLAAFGRDK